MNSIHFYVKDVHFFWNFYYSLGVRVKMHQNYLNSPTGAVGDQFSFNFPDKLKFFHHSPAFLLGVEV